MPKIWVTYDWFVNYGCMESFTELFPPTYRETMTNALNSVGFMKPIAIPAYFNASFAIMGPVLFKRYVDYSLAQYDPTILINWDLEALTAEVAAYQDARQHGTSFTYAQKMLMNVKFNALEAIKLPPNAIEGCYGATAFALAKMKDPEQQDYESALVVEMPLLKHVVSVYETTP